MANLKLHTSLILRTAGTDKLQLCASHRELLFISKVYIAELPQPDEMFSAQHNK